MAGHRDLPQLCGSPASVVARPACSPLSRPLGVKGHFLGFRRFSSELLLAETHGALSGTLDKKRPSLCGGIGADGRRGSVAGAEMPMKMRQQAPESDQFFVSLSSTEPLKRRLDVLLSGRTCSAFTSAYYGIDAGEEPYDWVLSLVERSTFC